MKYLKLILIIPMFSWASVTPDSLRHDIKTGGADKAWVALKQSDGWQTLLSGIAKGEPAWLNTLPLFASTANQQQRDALLTSLAFSLTSNPAATLDILPDIGKTIDKSEINLYDWQYLCPGFISLNYTKASAVRYYDSATEALRKIGDKGKECMALMYEGREELKEDEFRGKMTWGTKTWP
ncbi:hypothetical protein P0E69_08145 [Chimaeribacter arupi]|uniref:hypothetical protein n=1 Tax=Chimaeribacter arupi TaxID=2060066 RepID=UPI0027121650|nr:hypothetical protein [Chimaeribacter arupi]WKZ93842.1 hypothetical protein P0E69_08145 [Chimaeribacter arupi]